MIVWVVASGLACGGEGGSTDERDVGAAEETSVADSSVDSSVEEVANDATAETETSVDGAPPPVDTGVDAGPPPPSCAALAGCPGTPAGLTEGNGPKPIERCAFVLKDDGKDYETAITGLGAVLKKVPIADVLADLNRTATSVSSATVGAPGFQRGFAWDSDDEGKEWWIPQGLSGSFDANAAGTVEGKKVVAVTWYYDFAKQPGSTGEKGIRLSLADVTGTTVKYRHLLLVLPKVAGGRADFDPIDIHAGGVAWVGDTLWVVDTGSGIRAFDLTRIYQVATDKDSIGWDGTTYQGGLYKYVVPQKAFWTDGSKCNPVFSWVGLDRGSATLVTGEYDATAITGRVFQWPIDLGTGAMPKTNYAKAAWSMGQRQVQGGLTHGGAFWLSSSAPAAGKGVLYAAREAKKTTSYAWADAPEDLMFDPKTNQLWGASEGLNARWVFAVDVTKVSAP